ncbi:sigma-70 family RNA polymerase sigma factor [Putridiphycobacter roseus]|uniref:Sigma-70 family RNA polymerase sigma factor n=1 Tax=Putridiphycobacter roseus TaxID=2219161 RepID=A0A2W1NEJ4_9FLAO|nr:sigma-70 family RNA polymerase sigma factor [Putridiphycobacter roseus]PZE17523.1 sigma-70 family RNA polymerase sigma factor [Putridiphycobacter roseus]
MNQPITNYQSLNEFRVYIENKVPSLLKHKEAGDQASFNEQLLKILPTVRGYIGERLHAAIKKGHFPIGKYKADDFIDQLFIEVYDHIEEIEKSKDFYLWLFKKTNELLEDAMEEEEFDELYFKNIDKYTKPEWDEMEENYSIDAGGDLKMIEEFDDRSYNHNDYVLNKVFIEEDEKPLIEKLDKELKEEDINRHINMVLEKLPSLLQETFYLSTIQEFKPSEIAVIKNTSIQKVEKLLADARKTIKQSFINRFSIS